MAMEWTDELIAQLRDLWGQGLSTAEIGRRLSITKNAVVGKAHRLGLPPRPSPIRNRAAADGTAKVTRTRTPRAKKADTVKDSKAESSKSVKDAAEKAPKKAAKVVKVAADAEKTAKTATQAAGQTASVGSEEKVSAAKVAASPAAEARSAAPPRKALSPRRVREVMDRSTRQGPTCQWPHGDPGTPDFHFCGATPLPGKPYCAEHAAIAYVKIRDRRH